MIPFHRGGRLHGRANKSGVASVSDAYDAACKRLLSERQVLSRIMCGVLGEYRGLSLREVEDNCFVGEPRVGEEFVERDARTAARVRRLVGEDGTVSEGEVSFDVRFEALVPGGADELLIELDVEAQGLPARPPTDQARLLLLREDALHAGGFVSRSHYEQVRKVVSIWVYTSPSAENRETVTSFRLGRHDLVDHGSWRRPDWDLVEVVMICLDDGGSTSRDGVLGMHSVLFSPRLGRDEKSRRLKDGYGMIIQRYVEEEADRMCNLSEGVLEMGCEEGRAEATLEHVRKVMDKLRTSAQEALDFLGVPSSERPRVAVML